MAVSGAGSARESGKQNTAAGFRGVSLGPRRYRCWVTAPRVPVLRKQLIAVVDPATTMICLDCSGQVRDLSSEFHTLVGDFHQPPFHRWCRSVVIPYLPGGIDEQRAEANAEIGRRPLKERRKGPGGVGARRVPPPHAATFDRRGDLPSRDDTYLGTYDRLTPLLSDEQASSLARYLAASEIDRRLRSGDLDPDDLGLVAEVDAVLGVSRLREEVTVFTALRPPMVSRLRVSDVVSDDSYLQVSLDPAVAARWGHPVALTLPVGLPAAGLDRDTQRLLLARRHSWRLLALGVILVGILL